jgi:hypothetical protein
MNEVCDLTSLIEPRLYSVVRQMNNECGMVGGIRI